MIETVELRLAWAVAFGLFGLAVGSFLNVVIWRVPRKQSLVRPPSHCPSCASPVRPLDNIPIVSWVRLRGRCRTCGVAIAIRYPLVEAGAGMLFGAMAWHLETDWTLPAYLLLTATLVAVAVIDLEHYIVPNRLLGPVTAVSLPLLVIAAAVQDAWSAFGRAVAGAVVAFVMLFVIHLVSPRGMGMGDVKLAFLLGLFLGWIGWGHVMLGLFVGFLLGALVGGGLVAAGVRGRKEALPFAPFLSAGTVVAVLFGTPLLDWYAAL